MVLTPPVRRVSWATATRIIATRYPPIDLFERISLDPAVRDALIEAEMMTNPRLRDEIGEIRLVPPEDRVTGPGAGYVMAAFTHVNPAGSRFSDGSYGVYYAARDLATAVAETAYHFGRFARDSDDGPRYEDMRVLVCRIDRSFHDASRLPEPERSLVLDPDDYSAGRRLAGALRDAGSNGIVYPSVRRPGGHCVAAFRPKAVGLPVQAKHLKYHWDGHAVRRYFDYAEDRWCDTGL